jgi:leucine dehydrogenase
VFVSHKDTGLKAIIGVHNSVMALLWNEEECTVMLANGMTYKSAITVLNIGVGEVII